MWDVASSPEDYDFTLMPSLNKSKVLALSQGEFIAKKETVIFVGCIR